jgi:23S rRNA pseudouridine1911/1915/1917 synthase
VAPRRTAHQQRIDKVLATLASEFSRSHLQDVIAQGHVRLDGVTVTTASRRVRAGQQLHVTLWPTAQALAFTPQPIALAIVHEDEHVLVLDKPAGLVVHPAAGNWSAPCSTDCWRTTRRPRNCRVPASCTGSTRTPAG